MAAGVPGRLRRLREGLAEAGEDAAWLISKPENRRYLSGFTGSAGLLVISRDAACLVTDFRYVEQAQAEAPEYRVVRHGHPVSEALKPLLEELGIRRLMVEQDHLTVGRFEEFREQLAPVVLEPRAPAADRLRGVKDAAEIALIREAAAIATRALAQVVPAVRPGARERDVALELEFAIRRLGADASAFPAIVASGPRSALPHGAASDRVIRPGEFVTLDFGAACRGYHSDITRTFLTGEPTARQREVYEAVLRAQRAALEAVVPGRTTREVDAVAREALTGAGLGEYFGHGLGHGVGLAVHEFPSLSPSAEEVVLEAGMVVTVEPGAYLPGEGGVRVEDLVVVTETGAEVLTDFPKELTVLA